MAADAHRELGILRRSRAHGGSSSPTPRLLSKPPENAFSRGWGTLNLRPQAVSLAATTNLCEGVARLVSAPLLLYHSLGKTIAVACSPRAEDPHLWPCCRAASLTFLAETQTRT